MARQRIFLVVVERRGLAYLADRAALRRDLSAEGIGADDLVAVQLLGSPGRQLLPPTPRYREALEHLPSTVPDPGTYRPEDIKRVVADVRTAALYLAEDGAEPVVVVVRVAEARLGDLVDRLGVPVEGVRPVKGTVTASPARPSPAGTSRPGSSAAGADPSWQDILDRLRAGQGSTSLGAAWQPPPAPGRPVVPPAPPSVQPPLVSTRLSGAPSAPAPSPAFTYGSDGHPGVAALVHGVVTAAVLVGALVFLPGVGLRALYDRGVFDLFGGFPLPYVLVIAGLATLAAAFLGFAFWMDDGTADRATMAAGGVVLTLLVGVLALALCYGPPAAVLGAEHLLAAVRPHHDWSHGHWNAGTWWLFVLACVAVGSLVAIPIQRYNFYGTGFSWFLLVGSAVAGGILFFTAVPG